MKAWDWVLLVSGALMVVFLSSFVAHATPVVIWELMLNGETVSGVGDMTYEECEKRLPTDPELECVPSLVDREES